MSRKILIAVAVMGLTLVASAPAACAAGFGLEFEGGGNLFVFMAGMLNQEKTLLVVNQAVTEKKLTALSETSRNGGNEYFETNAGDRTACLNKKYAALETCSVKIKFIQESAIGPPFPELEFEALPAGCPNRASVVTGFPP